MAGREVLEQGTRRKAKTRGCHASDGANAVDEEDVRVGRAASAVVTSRAGGVRAGHLRRCVVGVAV